MKPVHVKIKPEGKLIKVFDFGWPRRSRVTATLHPVVLADRSIMSPTLTMHATRAGMTTEGREWACDRQSQVR
jgi:hypothetical protein